MNRDKSGGFFFLNAQAQHHREFDKRFGVEKPVGDAKSLLYMCTAIAGEVGEVCEIIKKWDRDGGDLDTENLASEAADVLVYLCMLAAYAPFDYSEAYDKKLEILETRWRRRLVAQMDGVTGGDLDRHTKEPER